MGQVTYIVQQEGGKANMGQNINTGNFGGEITGNYSSIWTFFYYVSYFKNDHLTFKKIFF